MRYGFRTIVAATAALVGLLAAGSATGRSQTEPANTKPPAIAKPFLVTVGTDLSGSPGSWSGTTPMKMAEQWLRCNDDAEACKDISGATDTTYTVTGDDVGHTIRFEVTATNSDGNSTAFSSPTNLIQPAATKAPVESAAPTITGDAIVGEKLTATTGTWQGDQPITYTITWQSCDRAVTSCTANGTKGSTYTVAKGDVGNRLRVRVVAANGAGDTPGVSDPTDVVAAQAATPPPPASKPPPGEITTLPNGEKSIAVTGVGAGERLVVDQVTFSPNPVTSRNSPIHVRIKVKDTQGHVVRGALVFIRSTPLVTSVPTDAPTATDGWISYSLQPESDFPLKNGYSVQFFVKAYRQGDPSLAGISGTRLVQVKTAT